MRQQLATLHACPGITEAGGFEIRTQPATKLAWRPKASGGRVPSDDHPAFEQQTNVNGRNFGKIGGVKNVFPSPIFQLKISRPSLSM